MNINTVKGVFIICVTIVLSFVLFIAYNEHIHRYCLVVAPNNDLYIFDKKNLTVNVCNRNGCDLIDTRLIGISNNKTDTFKHSQVFIDQHKKTMDDTSLVIYDDNKVAASKSVRVAPNTVTKHINVSEDDKSTTQKQLRTKHNHGDSSRSSANRWREDVANNDRNVNEGVSDDSTTTDKTSDSGDDNDSNEEDYVAEEEE